MAKKWYAARTQAGLGALAEKELGKTFMGRPPFRCFRVTQDGRSVFGPYIFIEFDETEDPWWMINGVRGVVKLLPTALPYPMPLPPGFIDEMRERMELGNFGLVEAEKFVHAWSIGERGVVTSGPWEGHSGPFAGKKKGFINLSMVVLGRAFDIPIPAHQVQPASRQVA